MNAKKKWECQGCLRLYDQYIDAAHCHPPKAVHVCGECDTQYDDPLLAERCCSYGVGPLHFDIDAIKKIRLDD